MIIENESILIEMNENSRNFWRYRLKDTDKTYSFTGPVFEVDGNLLEPLLTGLVLMRQPERLPNGCREYVVEGGYAHYPELSLRITLRIADDNPVVRFRYSLHSQARHKLTKAAGRDEISYITASYDEFPEVTEVRFSEFDQTIHSYCLSELPVSQEYFRNGANLMGPMLVGSDSAYTMLIAYEHGSQAPDAFVRFELESSRQVAVKAVKGNYYAGYELGEENPYETIWLEVGAVRGDTQAMAKAYRVFVLKYMALYSQSRKPYIFYNTWAFQERNKHWNGKTYLDSMNEDRILAEIEVAHKMGIEVFVLDAGWYEKTGEWRVSPERFPGRLKNIKEKLDRYAMKLGLWFLPGAAAVSSEKIRQYADCITSWEDKPSESFPVCETEDSKSMCLVSRFFDAFTDELIRLYREVGVTYFKWDGINQYRCSDSKHFHGTRNNSIQERKDCSAFQLTRYMTKAVEKLCRACPEAIVDFDITEGNRAMGLDFLSVGRFFLINNGPYYSNYDIPFNGNGNNPNIFMYPGTARARVCRIPLSFDKWIPSVLFLTHYLPDDSEENQNINIASLILGQNGIWGDLLSISEDGIKRISKLLTLYKQVRYDITESSLISYGMVGGSIEVREKISETTGRGAVSLFSEAPGQYCYITHNQVAAGVWADEGVSVELTRDGKAAINVIFKKPDARIVFFGC